ncbi:GAF domain-containing protein [Aquincola tertiaricarbonis]|uniref:GAF domain-containing protein n=1 Tax=Aquincola tertiaricarbonis TaxID=391953 RepID=UPI000614B829|nr:GAF domain-containing protein [Aquincola tertiaricarbonis]
MQRQVGETERQDILARYAILDTAREDVFDQVVRIAAKECDVPMALVSFVDARRQWFKAEFGFGTRETGLDKSICVKAIEHEGVFVVPNAEEDPRVCANPLVIGEPGIRFYAGAPLMSSCGVAVGMICVLDTRARVGITPAQQDCLVALAAGVMRVLEGRCHQLPSAAEVLGVG